MAIGSKGSLNGWQSFEFNFFPFFNQIFYLCASNVIQGICHPFTNGTFCLRVIIISRLVLMYKFDYFFIMLNWMTEKRLFHVGCLQQTKQKFFDRKHCSNENLVSMSLIIGLHIYTFYAWDSFSGF